MLWDSLFRRMLLVGRSAQCSSKNWRMSDVSFVPLLYQQFEHTQRPPRLLPLESRLAVHGQVAQKMIPKPRELAPVPDHLRRRRSFLNSGVARDVP